jgi:hypothetical protein
VHKLEIAPHRARLPKKLKLKKKKTTTQEKYAFMATIHTIKICLYGKDDNILVF